MKRSSNILLAATAAAILAGTGSAANAHPASLPPGLTLGSRMLTYADTYAPTGEAVVTASNPQGRPSRAPIWIESPASHEVATGDGEAALRLDAATSNDTSETVIVHDAFGGVVTLSTRPFGSQTIRLAVQVDGQGRLLPVPTVRLKWNHQKAVVTFTRDNDFDGPLAVVYRVFDLNAGAGVAPVEKTATIAAGAASVDVPQPTYGLSYVAYAGDEYTTDPAANSDVIQGLPGGIGSN